MSRDSFFTIFSRLRSEGRSTAEIAAETNRPIKVIAELQQIWAERETSGQPQPKLAEFPQYAYRPPTERLFNAKAMRQSYLHATARLLFVHGPNCYAGQNVQPRGADA